MPETCEKLKKRLKRPEGWIAFGEALPLLKMICRQNRQNPSDLRSLQTAQRELRNCIRHN